MDIYRVKGTFRMGRKNTSFTKEITGSDKDEVRERLLSILGSKHYVSRRFISIESMEKISVEDATDQVAIYNAGKK